VHFNSIFISDIHLGTKRSKVKKLLAFLENNTANNIFLIGDIIDMWALQRTHFWNDKHTEVIRLLLKLSFTSNVYYIPGNHDDFIRPFLKPNLEFGSIKIANQMTYSAIDGRNILVIHGDTFDFWMKVPKKVINSLARISDYFPIPAIREAKQAGTATRRHLRQTATERSITKYSKAKGYDAVICGHTHMPKLTSYYMNTGDWVHNNSVIVETETGEWSLIE